MTPYELTEAEQAALVTLRRILVVMAIVVAVIGAGGAVLGLIVAGTPGLLSGLVGAALALVYSGLTVVSVIVAIRVGGSWFLGVILGFWIAKFGLFLVTVIVLRATGAVEPWFTVGTMLVAAVATLGVDVVVVLRARVPISAAPAVAPVDASAADVAVDATEAAPAPDAGTAADAAADPTSGPSSRD